MAAAWSAACEHLEIGNAVCVSVEQVQPTRTLEQNALMWAVLSDISRQVQWPVDGAMQWLSKEDWKEIMSAALKRHQRVAQGVDGGFVVLGQRTSKMTIAEMSDMIEVCRAFGAERGVVWSDPMRTPA